MKTKIQLILIGGILAFWSVPSSYAAVTNVVTFANFSLTGIKQAGDRTVPVRIGNKEILGALNNTGHFNFGSGAHIIFVSYNDQLPRMAVREGTGTDTTTTDISGYLSVNDDGEIHGAGNMISYSLQTFSFNDRNGTSFTVSGVTTLHRGTITGPGIGALSRVKTLSSPVTGAGSADGADAVFRGTVSGNSAKAEVD